MSAFSQIRFIPNAFKDHLKKLGASPGDGLEIEVFQERKKIINLTRKKYEFILGDSYNFETLNCVITLPRFGDQIGHFQMQLIFNETSSIEDDSRYLFKSLGTTPFKINGVLSYESFVEKSDCIEIGYNKIIFKNLIEPSEDSNELINDSIIKSNLSVFIEGETGTGKTSLAKKIHENSNRQGQFVHLNLSSFSQNLIESEIFGHIKGAFTGAINSKRGAISLAHKGTLFLDEIDSLTIDLQTKLLLFLDNFEYRSVGSESVQKSDVRLIVASGQNLNELVVKGKMRRDFFYRITSGHSLRLKSLREDERLIRKACREYEIKNHVVIDNKLLELYSKCKFPGNYRQLQSILNKKKVLSNGKKLTVDNSDYELINEKIEHAQEHFDKLPTIEEVKKNYIFKAYCLLDKNIYKTAKVLDMSPNTVKSYLIRMEASYDTSM